MEASVLSIEGTDTGRTVSLATSIFELEAPNDHAIYQDVRLILANKRQGTHKAKERGEIKGTNKKPYRQKGTGSARRGDRKSPLLVGGGRIFGPRPRNYGFKLNKKARDVARKGALTYKAREEKVTVVEDFEFEVPKTKKFLNILEKLNLGGEKTLLVLPEQDNNVYLAGRNLPKVKVTTAGDLNTYDILHADTLLLTEQAANAINERFEK